MGQPIVIVGCGMYGCVVGWILHRKGIEFRMMDRTNAFFRGSSGKNQYRLHTGLHYPRSRSTQEECIRGYSKFKRYFPEAVQSVDSYYVFHPDGFSFTYDSRQKEELQFEEIRAGDFPFQTTLSVPILKTNEFVIDCDELSQFFRNHLSRYLVKYDESEINNQENKIIDCTYGSLYPHPDYRDEFCTLLEYKVRNSEQFGRKVGITVMDGNFFSLFPSMRENEYTLSHVYWSRNVENRPEHELRARMEACVNDIFPDLMDTLGLEFVGSFTSRKVKPVNSPEDNRSVCVYYPREGVMSIVGGKMTGVFDAIPSVFEFIGHRIPFMNIRLLNQQYREQFHRILDDVLTSGEYSIGERTRQFEGAFAEYLGVEKRQVLTCQSGTQALELVYRSIDLEEGDEIIVPGNTFIATAMAIPAFCRILPVDIGVNHTISLESIQKLVSGRTRVVVVVHMFGWVWVELDKIRDFCGSKGIYLVEDCAQSLGTRYRGRHTGTFGDFSCFSFYPGKNLGSLGEGGMVVSRHHWDKLGKMRNLGAKVKYQHEVYGTNGRLSAFQAGVLGAKLVDLEGQIRRKRELASVYYRELGRSHFVVSPYQEMGECSFHLMVYDCGSEAKRARIRGVLGEKGIETNIHYPEPWFLSGVFRGRYGGGCENVEAYSRCILSLPLDPTMMEEEVEWVCSIVRSV